MAHTKEKGGQEEHQKKHVFSKVKDKVNFTKHLGFQSGADSMANRQALANARAREQREPEEGHNPQPDSQVGPEDGLGGIADTLAGAVTPKVGGLVSGGAPPADEQNEQGSHSKGIQFDEAPTHSMDKIEKDKPSEEQGKEKSQESEKGWGGWMAHKMHQVSRAAASKDLSDELLKESKAKK